MKNSGNSTKIDKRLERKNWEEQEGPIFKGMNIRYEMDDRHQGIACEGIRVIHLMAKRLGLVKEIDKYLHMLKPHLPYKVGNFKFKKGGREFQISISRKEKKMEYMFEMEWPSLKAKVDVELLMDKNPDICKVFWDSMPFETIQLHAVVTGEDMYAYAPVNEVEFHKKGNYPVVISEAPVGSVTYSVLGLVAVYYGPCTENLKTQKIGQVNEKHLGILKSVGKAVWDSMYNSKKPIKVVFRKK